MTQAILTEVLPVAENAVDGFVTTIKSQATGETGWKKWRDGIVLPLLLEGAVYVVKTVLIKTVEKMQAA